MNKLITTAVLALALAGAPLAAANARTNVTVGIGIGGPVYGGYYRPGYRVYTRDDIMLMLSRQGYRVDYVDARDGGFFVRAFYGPEYYEGFVGARDGRWIRRDRIVYHAGWHPGYRWDHGRWWR